MHIGSKTKRGKEDRGRGREKKKKKAQVVLPKHALKDRRKAIMPQLAATSCSCHLLYSNLEPK